VGVSAVVPLLCGPHDDEVQMAVTQLQVLNGRGASSDIYTCISNLLSTPTRGIIVYLIIRNQICDVAPLERHGRNSRPPRRHPHQRRSSHPAAAEAAAGCPRGRGEGGGGAPPSSLLLLLPFPLLLSSTATSAAAALCSASGSACGSPNLLLGPSDLLPCGLDVPGHDDGDGNGGPLVVHVVGAAAPATGSACWTVGSAFPRAFRVGVRRGQRFPVLAAAAGAPRRQQLRTRSACCTRTALCVRCSATAAGGLVDGQMGVEMCWWCHGGATSGGLCASCATVALLATAMGWRTRDAMVA
jgi:hypothetical protein